MLSPVTEDSLYAELSARIGRPVSGDGRAVAPDPVNLAMIRHWVDALDDRNPAYLASEPVAPPAMLQTWTMGRPQIAGIAARGGSPAALDPNSPLELLKQAGFTGTLATNSELEFSRYLRLGDQVSAVNALEEISELKATGLGAGYFVTWVTTYTAADAEIVGRQRFRVLKFNPGLTLPPQPKRDKSASAPPAPTVTEALPPWELDVTATVIVAGAIASRDFMPAHHDRDFAKAQGAPDIFMNILTSTGYLSRYVTDWAGETARIRRLALRLGGPVTPGQTLRFTGSVTSREETLDRTEVELSIRAETSFGEHLSATVSLHE